MPTTTSAALGGSRRLEGARHFLDLVRLEEISDLDIVEVLDADTAFETFLDLADVLLEPLEAGEIPRPKS